MTTLRLLLFSALLLRSAGASANIGSDVPYDAVGTGICSVSGARGIPHFT